MLPMDFRSGTLMSDKQYFPYLDGWRGLAIAFLLIGHFFPVPGINLGAVGVNLFFVLSGMLMARILFLDRVAIDTFYRRRIARIFPTAFAYFFIITLAYVLAGLPVNWRELLAASAFVNNYFPGEAGNPAMPFGHIWSLSVEEHSYIVLSLVAVFVRRGDGDARLPVCILAAIFAAIGLLYWATYQGTHLHFERWMHSEVSAYAIFASALALLWFGGSPKPQLAVWAVPALAAIGLALQWWSVPLPAATVIGCGALALAVNFLDRAPAFVRATLSLRPLRQLGLWSFSIYLWQQPFYLLVHRTNMAPGVGLALGVLAGIASFYLIENPARLWLNRVWGARPLPAAAGA
jgi:peptidoglycan/LPS O-acetylase OafA/YrhL